MNLFLRFYTYVPCDSIHLEYSEAKCSGGILACRFICDRNKYQQPSTSFMLVTSYPTHLFHSATMNYHNSSPCWLGHDRPQQAAKLPWCLQLTCLRKYSTSVNVDTMLTIYFNVMSWWSVIPLPLPLIRKPSSLLPTARSLAGALRYSTPAWSYLAFAIQQVDLHMHAPPDTHNALVKHILRQGNDGQWSSPSSLTDDNVHHLHQCGCQDSSRSTVGKFNYPIFNWPFRNIIYFPLLGCPLSIALYKSTCFILSVTP